MIPVTEEQIGSLRKCIEDKIALYSVKRKRNKAGAIIIQALVIIFSFGTTILIGWKLQGENDLKNTEALSSLTNFALIVSALATGVTTLDKFFDYKVLWIGYNISISNLKGVEAKLDYLASLKPEQIRRDQLDDIFHRYEIICANMDKSYQQIRSSRDE